LVNSDENHGFFRVDSPSFVRQSLQTGETLGGISNIFGWFVLTMSLFVIFASVTIKIKKIKRK